MLLIINYFNLLKWYISNRNAVAMKEILQYQGYEAFIQFSVADGVFYGKILGIDDLVVLKAPPKKK
jgi:hypothetical protein